MVFNDDTLKTRKGYEIHALKHKATFDILHKYLTYPSNV